VGQTKHLEARVAYHNSNYSLALRNRTMETGLF